MITNGLNVITNNIHNIPIRLSNVNFTIKITIKNTIKNLIFSPFKRIKM